MEPRVQIICSIDNLAAYAGAWRDILVENQNDNPYVTPDWIMGWWRYFGDDHEMCILMLSDGERPLGFFPLMSHREKGCLRVNLIGYPQTSRTDFIVRKGYERVFAQKIAEHLLSARGAVLYTLHGFRQEDACYGYFRQALGDTAVTVRTLPASTIDLTGYDRDSLIRTKRRHNTIRSMLSRERKLTGFCDLRFEQAQPEEMEIVFAIHEKRWRRKNDRSGFDRGESRAFFTWLANEQWAKDFNVLVYLLKAGRRIIGFAYGIECNGRFWFYRIAHDDDFAYFKPGMITTKRIIEKCLELGHSSFDFATGDETYKRYWDDEAEWVDQITFGTGSPASALTVRLRRVCSLTRCRLRKNKGLIYLKRVAAGRIRYACTGEPFAAVFGRACRVIRQRGWTGLAACMLKQWLPGRGIRLYSLPPYEETGRDGVLDVRTAALDETDELSALILMNGGAIVERYARGSRCQIFLRAGTPVGWTWMSQSELNIKGNTLWRPEGSGDRCFYDCCVIGRQRGEDILSCMAGQGQRTLLLRAWDRRLRRAAEKAAGSKPQKTSISRKDAR